MTLMSNQPDRLTPITKRTETMYVGPVLDPVPGETIVAFHAHPDDETFFTGGTLAKLSAAGCRVLIVTATDGHETTPDTDRPNRLDSLRGAASALAADNVVCLGYADSGFEDDGYTVDVDPPGRRRLANVPSSEVALKLREIIDREQPVVLTCYDKLGGYGHPDHIKIHDVALQVAHDVPGLTVWQATLPRETFNWWTELSTKTTNIMCRRDKSPRRIYTPKAEINHTIDVSDFLDHKLDALAAHVEGGHDPGVNFLGGVIRRAPRMLVSRFLGHEYFVATVPSGVTPERLSAGT